MGRIVVWICGYWVILQHGGANLKDISLLNFSHVLDFISGAFQGASFFSAITLETPLAFNELHFALYLHLMLKLL